MLSTFVIVLSVFRTIFSWCLPLCVVGVILADYWEVRRHNLTLSALRNHRHSLAHYHVLSSLMVCVTCITYWVIAGSPADMFFLSRTGTKTPYFSTGLSQTGFDARFLFLPTFAIFASMMMLSFWSAAMGNGPRVGLYGIGGCGAAVVLTCLVLVWGEIGTRMRYRCERFCPAGKECGCGSFYQVTLPLVIVEFLLLLVHAVVTVRIWRKVRGYSPLDAKNADMDMEAPDEMDQDGIHMTQQGTDSAAAYY